MGRYAVRLSAQADGLFHLAAADDFLLPCGEHHGEPDKSLGRDIVAIIPVQNLLLCGFEKLFVR